MEIFKKEKMEEKPKITYQTSTFLKDIIFFIIAIAVLLISFHYNYDWKNPMYIQSFIIFGRIFSIVGIFLKLCLVHSSLDKALNYKYKIIKKGYQYYEAKVLRSWFWFIIYWESVDESYHTYKDQNIFGAKQTRGYSTELTYDSFEEAKEAIEKYKKAAKEQRKKYFKKQKIEKIETIIV